MIFPNRSKNSKLDIGVPKSPRFWDIWGTPCRDDRIMFQPTCSSKLRLNHLVYTHLDLKRAKKVNNSVQVQWTTCAGTMDF